MGFFFFSTFWEINSHNFAKNYLNFENKGLLHANFYGT